MPSKTRQKKRAVSEDLEEDEQDIIVDEAPTSINPYTVLSVEKDATQDQIKSAYRRAALQHHPDKVTEAEKEVAHTKFQEIAFAYAILSDPRRRSRYDATGRTEEILDDDEDFNWTDFFREQYAAVTEEAIGKFSEEYKGSEEEERDLLAAYEKFQGSMSKIYQTVMLSDPVDDEDRFRGIIFEAIEKGEVESYDNFTGESEKKRKARVEQARRNREREAREVAKAEKDPAEEDEEDGKKPKKGAKAGGGGMDDLAAMIQQRQKGRAENFFDGLEAKYASNGKSGTKRGAGEPSEEAFAKNRSKKAKK